MVEIEVMGLCLGSDNFKLGIIGVKSGDAKPPYRKIVSRPVRNRLGIGINFIKSLIDPFGLGLNLE